MSIDPFDGRNPSYCFVEVPSDELAQLAMNTMQGQLVRGRPVRINTKTERHSQFHKRQSVEIYARGWSAKEAPGSPGLEAVSSNRPAFDRWTRDDPETH